MAITRRLVIEGGWIPDSGEDAQDIQVYVDACDLVFVVMGDGSGEVRMSIDEWDALVVEMTRLHEEVGGGDPGNE